LKSLLKAIVRKKVYRDVWVILTNTIMLFLAANLTLAFLFLAKDKISSFGSNQEPARSIEQGKFDYTAYEGIVDQTYASAVLDDFNRLGRLGFVYQPWVQFSEPSYEGKLVNVEVDSLGFSKRKTRNEEHKEKSSRLRIFTFGGSTTFGYNVSDEHTWPSYLSDILNSRAEELGLDVRIEVTNYGRNSYYTTQEVLLLEQLLRRGQRPNLVIFLDGVNEGRSCMDEPWLTDKLRTAMHNLQFPVAKSFAEKIDWLPIARLAKAVNQRLFTPRGREHTNMPTHDCLYDLRNIPEKGVEAAVQYEHNIKIARFVSKLYNVETLFLLQPDARYNYPTELYRDQTFAKEFIQSYHRYNEMFYSKCKNIEGVIDLTNLFRLWGDGRKAIIDDIHYSPKFNHFLAQHVADQIRLGSLWRSLAAARSSAD